MFWNLFLRLTLLVLGLTTTSLYAIGLQDPDFIVFKHVQETRPIKQKTQKPLLRSALVGQFPLIFLPVTLILLPAPLPAA